MEVPCTVSLLPCPPGLMPLSRAEDGVAKGEACESAARRILSLPQLPLSSAGRWAEPASRGQSRWAAETAPQTHKPHKGLIQMASSHFYLQIRKLRPREGKGPAQGHTGRWQTKARNAGRWPRSPSSATQGRRDRVMSVLAALRQPLWPLCTPQPQWLFPTLGPLHRLTPLPGLPFPLTE